MKILENKENFLLKRREILAIVEADKTPSFNEANELIAKDMKVDKEVVVIKKIDSDFGVKNFKIKAFIYNSKEDKEKIEKKPKEKKTAGPGTNAPSGETKK